MSDDAPAAPPAAGERTAVLPAALIPALPYLLGGAAAIGARQYLKQRYERNGVPFTRSPELPSAPPSRPLDYAHDGLAKTPPLIPPKLDHPPPGRPETDRLPESYPHIPPDTKEWISGLPPAQQPVAEGLFGIIMEINPHGSRGKPETEKANRIMVRLALRNCRPIPLWRTN